MKISDILRGRVSPDLESNQKTQPETQGRNAIEPQPPAQLPPPPEIDSRTHQAAQKVAGIVQDLEPIMDVLGIDKPMRGKIVFNLLVKGKMPGGLNALFGGKDNRTRMEKFWDGMMGGAPFILLVYALLIFTALIHRWGWI